jgi:hypothetical protein
MHATGLRCVAVSYRRRDGRVTLFLTVWVTDDADWRTRARRVGHIVGELTIQRYDLESEE